MPIDRRNHAAGIGMTEPISTANKNTVFGRLSVKRFWLDVVTIGGRINEDHPEHRRVYLINVMLLFTLAVTGIFFHFHVFWTGITILGVLNLAGFVTTLASALYLRFKCRIEQVASILNVIAFLGLGVYLILRHDEDQAYVWATVYFPFAFFLKGRRIGALCAGLYYLLVMAGVLYNMTVVDPATPAALVRTSLNITASLLAVAGILYYYEATRVEAMERLSNVQEKLVKLSTTDALTGLYNRRHFDDVMPVLLAKTQREGGMLCLLILDVDSFKAYNDRYGHPQGDRVLKTIAEVMAVTLKRTSDLTFRLGGEEFAALFTVTDPAEAENLAEEVRAGVEAQAVPSADSPLGKVTVSIGLRHYRSGSSTAEPSARALVSEADQALYQAKHQGRNQVVVYRQQG